MGSPTAGPEDRFRPETTPRWRADGPLLPHEIVDAFDRSARHMSVGVEEELMLLEEDTLELAPVVNEVLARLDGDPRFRREIRTSQIELVTPVSGNARAAGIHAAQGRIDLAAAVPGITPAASGTHPFSTRWGGVGNDDRYRALVAEYVGVASGDIPSGLHVHVAIGPSERALAVYNAARSYLPELTALAANSPFLGGRDTGLASARRPLNGAFHRIGVPPAFPRWDDFTDLLAWERRGGLLPDATHFWWDLRLHPRFGTLELRATDAQTRLDDLVAIAAVFQTLVAWLAHRYDAREPLPVHDSIRIGENLWRATRYGVRAWMVDLATGDPEPARDRIASLLDHLAPVARGLGNEDAIHTAQALVADNGAERQRYVHARAGLVGLTRWLAEETVASAREAICRRV